MQLLFDLLFTEYVLNVHLFHSTQLLFHIFVTFVRHQQLDISGKYICSVFSLVSDPLYKWIKNMMTNSWNIAVVLLLLENNQLEGGIPATHCWLFSCNSIPDVLSCSTTVSETWPWWQTGCKTWIREKKMLPKARKLIYFHVQQPENKKTCCHWARSFTFSHIHRNVFPFSLVSLNIFFSLLLWLIGQLKALHNLDPRWIRAVQKNVQTINCKVDPSAEKQYIIRAISD